MERHPQKPKPTRAQSNNETTRILHEIQKLNDSVQRVEQRLDKIESAQVVPQPPLAVRDIKETHDRVFKEAISNAREHQEILKNLADLQKQIQEINKKTTEPTRRDVPEPQKRVGIFVDVQNIFYASKQFNARLDFDKLLKVSVGSRRLIRAMAYVVQSPEVDQSGFISMLQQKSYEVRRKDLRQRSDGSAKGDWDMGMAIDIMRFVNTLDVVVLVSGDGDFVSLVNLVKTIGPRVEVVSFLHNSARDLIHSADKHIPIEHELLLKNISPAEIH
ncbi:MAG: NYN domain-containing protein [Candidatus Latescibacteria bacterium]|jgi:uncharacterized LabA/DUF88 family protein|nr:NYN domain-containing protein [Candidatus Latescibacterota bacterium]